MSAATDIIFNDVIHQQRRIHVLSSTLFFYSALVALEGQRGGHLSLVAHWPCSVEHTVVTCPWPLLVSVSPCSLFPLFLSSSISLYRSPPDLALSFSISLWQGEGGRAVRSRYSITTQLLILYYILSYEEALLSNTKQLGMYPTRSPPGYVPWGSPSKTIVYVTPERHSFSHSWLLS